MHKTGNCDDTMHLHSWNVTAFQGRSGRIRVVDASSDVWGHINVDELSFDWDVYGGHVDVSDGYAGGQLARGRVDTPLSGSAYVFQLTQADGSKDKCRKSASVCHWAEEGKLLPSDKRSFSQFGASVAVDQRRGLVAVGAPGAFLTGMFREIQSEHPYDNLTITQLPVSERDITKLFNAQTHTIERDASAGLWQLQQILQDIPCPAMLSAERAGATYIYARYATELVFYV